MPAGRRGRRVVEVRQGSPARGRLWAYGYADLAALLGYSEGYLRHMVRLGRFDAGDLEAVCRAWAARGGVGGAAPPVVASERPVAPARGHRRAT